MWKRKRKRGKEIEASNYKRESGDERGVATDNVEEKWRNRKENNREAGKTVVKDENCLPEEEGRLL